MTESGNSRSMLGPFLGYFADFKKLFGVILALAAAPFLLDLVFGIGPPWPHRRGVILLTSIGAWVMLLWSYSLWRLAPLKDLKSRLTPCAAVAVGSLMVYLLLHAFFVYDAPDSRNQEAAGFLLQPKIKEYLPNLTAKSLTFMDLVAGEGYDPNEIWVPWTVALVRYGLIISWLCLFGGLSLVASSFLLLQEKISASKGGLAEWGGEAPPKAAAKRTPKKQTSPAAESPPGDAPLGNS